jgi:hypothetical protein
MRANWDEVAKQLKAMGGSDELIEETNRVLQKQGVTVATII